MADAAQIIDYLGRGWKLVPLVRGQKNPKDGGWLKASYSKQDFDETHNIGVKLGEASGGLVDLDLDTPLAVPLAKDLLPLTGAIFGRPSKPMSHYLFHAPGIKTRQFKGLDGQVLIEMRSTGAQTMFPDSLHPSGEPVTWESDRAPLELSQGALELAAARLAVATLIAQHWPAGSRHVASGHCGGVLARCGYSPLEVEETVKAIVTAVGEGKWAKDNARFARESAEKLEAGDANVTGGPAFAELFPNGKDLLRLIYTWLGRGGDDQIDTLNKQHFVVPLGKDMVVGTEDPDEAEVLFQTFSGFEQRYYNTFIGKKKLGKFWLEHERCRRYTKVVFAPPPLVAKPGQYNLWRGFACEPAPTVSLVPLERYLTHIHEVICDGNRRYTDYVLDLLAITVQQPGTPTGKALALRGPQGVGKSVFVHSFGRLFGRHFTTVSSRKHITGEFNAHLSGKVVVFADEAVWGGNRQDVGTLKRLITERTVMVERKGVDSAEERNCIHLFMATNEAWVFPAGDRERRGIVLDVDGSRSKLYYDQLWSEVNDPGFLPALLAFLLERDTSAQSWRDNLDTAGLRDQQELSADPVRQWWREKLDEGRLGVEDCWPEFVDIAWMYEDFQKVMGRHGAGHATRETPRTLMKKVRALLPGNPPGQTRYMKINTATYGTPYYVTQNVRAIAPASLSVCRHFFDDLTGTKNDWEEPLPMAKPDPALMREINALAKDDL